MPIESGVLVLLDADGAFTEMSRQFVQIISLPSQQFEFLRAARCDFVRGYYIGRPMPVEEFRDYLITTLV